MLSNLRHALLIVIISVDPVFDLYFFQSQGVSDLLSCASSLRIFIIMGCKLFYVCPFPFQNKYLLLQLSYNRRLFLSMSVFQGSVQLCERLSKSKYAVDLVRHELMYAVCRPNIRIAAPESGFCFPPCIILFTPSLNLFLFPLYPFYYTSAA